MAVYRLASIDALMSMQHAQSLDVNVRNVGGRSFEALLEVSSYAGIIYRGLCSIQPYTVTGLSHWFRDVAATSVPLELRVITNAMATNAATVEVHVKQYGQVIGIFTQEHFEMS